MQEVPTLFSLCIKGITMTILHGHGHVQDVLELPSDLLDVLVMNLPPLALENLYELSVDNCGKGGFSKSVANGGRKRGRHEDFNAAWKLLFKKRWPEHFRKIQLGNCLAVQETSQDIVGMHKINHGYDWQQLYWELHVQDCLDEAAETALLPAFNGHIGELTISDDIMKTISHGRDTKCECSKLSYHCNKFGCYARSLRLQNVLCVAEICELLRDSKLQALVFRRIISKAQVNGVCMLLNQQRDTLLSLEFIHCQLPPTIMNQICSCICNEGTQAHRIQHLCVKSSTITENKSSSSIPTGLLSFLSFGRSLCSLCFVDTKLQPKFAKLIFDTLLKSSCGVATLDISDNNIAGWLSKVDRKSSTYFPSLLASDLSLKSLTALSLRGNNLHKDDAEDLRHILVHLPKLRSLDISDNPIMDDGIRSLFPYLTTAREKAYPLVDLKIDNCSLSGLGVSELLRNLPTSKEPLHILSLADNDLGSFVAEPLAEFLGTSRVEVLNIEEIGLGPLGFLALEKELPKDIALVSINISKNRGGIRAAYFISKVILQAPNLVSINAGGNIMPPESLAVIHGALKQSKGKLELLDLTDNTQLSQSNYASMLREYCCQGKPIVIIPSPSATSTLYDDDP